VKYRQLFFPFWLPADYVLEHVGKRASQRHVVPYARITSRDIKICIAISLRESDFYSTSRHSPIHHSMYQYINLEEAKTFEYNCETVGKRVRFKSTVYSRSILRFNDLGTVMAVDNLSDLKGRQTILWIRWDNGSHYPLIDGVDSFDIFGGEAGI
jgi:hypothetical protein